MRLGKKIKHQMTQEVPKHLPLCDADVALVRFTRLLVLGVCFVVKKTSVFRPLKPRWAVTF